MQQRVRELVRDGESPPTLRHIKIYDDRESDRRVFVKRAGNRAQQVRAQVRSAYGDPEGGAHGVNVGDRALPETEVGANLRGLAASVDLELTEAGSGQERRAGHACD